MIGSLLSDDDVTVILDPYTGGTPKGNFMGYLRSLPLLVERGITHYTFSPSWLRYETDTSFDAMFEERGKDHEEQPNGPLRFTAIPEFEFNYSVIGSDADPESDHFDHLCQVVSQSVEDHSKTSTTLKLFKAYKRDRINQLALVLDSADFQINGRVSTRSLNEELDSSFEITYEDLAENFVDGQFGSPSISFKHTHNVWLHGAAVEYEQQMDSRPLRIADLFDYDELHPEIRTWKILEFLASSGAEEDKKHISNTVRPWVEGDITKITEHIQNTLIRFDYDQKQIREYRESNSES